MAALPPPLPPAWPEAPTSAPARSPEPKRRPVMLLVLVALVAWVAGLAGAFVGVQLAEWRDQPPTRASDKPLNVGERTGAADGSVDVAAIVDFVAPSVVTISADLPGGRSVGTGVIITSDGEILTNAHVIEGASEVRVRLAGESEPREASVLASDPGNDLALLRMAGDGFAAATFADPDSVQIGDEVVAIGFALGLDGDPSVTRGIVSALDRSFSAGDSYLNGLIQTDASISSGNSGGPLVNADGQVVGINTAVARDTPTTAATNISFAISAKEALPVIDALRAQAGGAMRTEAFLGVGLADRTDGGQGAIVTEVESGTPAAAAGIEAGDLIVAVGDRATDGSAGLIAAIRDMEPGDVVALTIVRDGERQTVEATLIARPES